MEEYFDTIECDNIDDLETKCLSLLNGKDIWVFRGQENAEWKLDTTFTRTCDLCAVPQGNREEIEGLMRREFKRRLYQYKNNLPDNSHKDEWLALMQHYGAPTRLLDFTYSPYVGIYFAFERAKINSQVALWAFNTTWNNNGLNTYSPELDEAYKQYQYNRDWNQFSGKISNNSIPKQYILNLNPFRLNERLTDQRGVFLYQGDVSTNLEENILAFSNAIGYNGKSITKFVINNDANGNQRSQALLSLTI